MISETEPIESEDLRVIAERLYEEIRDVEGEIAKVHPGDENYGTRMNVLARRIASDYLPRINNVFLAKDLFFGKVYVPIYAGHLSMYRSAARIFVDCE